MRVFPGPIRGIRRTRPAVPGAREEPAPRLWPHILGAWVVTVGGVCATSLGILWFLGFPEIDRPDQIPVTALDAIATRAFAVVAGLSGIALLVIAYHRQRNNNQENLRARKAAEREDVKLFNDRFTAAYTELGGGHAAVRLGAVHALAHLADDAPDRELRQTCIDVLCAYVRMPYGADPGSGAERAVEHGSLLLLSGQEGTARQSDEDHARRLESASFREVRHSILRVVSDRLRQADSLWQGHNFDFTGAAFDGGHFRRLDLVSGRLNFDEARFNGGEVDFRYSRFGRATVSFRRAHFNGGTVNFRHVRLSGRHHGLPGGRGGDPEAVRLQGTHVDFAKARFDGAEVLFHDSRFEEGGASFHRSEFVAGSVEFTKDGAEEASGTPPFGLLDAVAESTPGVVALPRPWIRPENGSPYSAGSTPAPEDPPTG
ncbi:pentapeptide repeat-containing protein [Nocardiopsis quinghaiensis]|uniref:pentapeptide repeat-containing protein n=1 Tax=Nocardiopsis quinghaiensis TaxID=464995 RepID=UPI0016811286|nr:pentapeptide repeat-containing protein [Nocardiopsis quinghaiensis]